VQARHFGPQLPPEPSTQIVQTKKRSVEALDAENLPIYNAENGCGPRSRRFVEVTHQKAVENARRKNLLRVLVRLHADASEHKVQQWRKFLLNPSNKKGLHRIYGKGVETGLIQNKVDRQGHFSCESDCYEITSQAANIVEGLNSTQEEADTRLILHAAHQLNQATRRWLWHQKIQTYSCFAWRLIALFGIHVCQVWSADKN